MSSESQLICQMLIMAYNIALVFRMVDYCRYGREAQPAPGNIGIVATVLVIIINFTVLYCAGAFSMLVN